MMLYLEDAVNCSNYTQYEEGWESRVFNQQDEENNT
jgi:hypothetical protein